MYTRDRQIEYIVSQSADPNVLYYNKPRKLRMVGFMTVGKNITKYAYAYVMYVSKKQKNKHFKHRRMLFNSFQFAKDPIRSFPRTPKLFQQTRTTNKAEDSFYKNHFMRIS